MILAIDIGNSTTSVGLFDGSGALTFRSDLTTSGHATRDQCAINLRGVFSLYSADLSSVTGVMISSVVPSVTANMRDAAELLTGKPPMVMGPGVKTGLNIKSDIHAQMGSDIVSCAVAALSKYSSPVIVIDLGTAVTMSYLRGNTYEGCVILPGIQVSLEALSQRAAELPHISIEAPPSIFGHNTVEAMRAGILYGSASMIDGMIERLEQEGGGTVMVVATGACGSEALHHCKRKIQYDANLMLEGLYLVYRRSTESKRKA